VQTPVTIGVFLDAKKAGQSSGLFRMVEAAGIELASARPLRSVLYA
jgi:hypothetical protein